jgi:DNA polymerase-3 subunit beta
MSTAMKFKINRDHFANGLQQVLNVVGTRATMPILSNVLIEAAEGYIAVTTTNLDLGIRCRIKAEVETSGTLTLPVRKLFTIVKELPKLEVQVEATGGNQAKITSGGSLFRVMGIEGKEFPPLPEFKDQHSFIMPQDDLEGMLKSVSYAMSTDENRYILNGVYFNFENDKLNLVATDGRRLGLVGKEMEVSDENAGSLILPAKTVTELQRLLGQGEELKIAFNERQVAFELNLGDDSEAGGLIENIYLVSKIVEGNYPNFRQVIPKETEHRIKVERELLQECIHRASLVTSDKNNSVKLKMTENLLEISGQSAEYGESRETMAIAFEGPETTVAFNPQFLMEPLKALDNDEVFFEFKDELSPGVFKTLEDFLCVVMPLRLT